MENQDSKALLLERVNNILHRSTFENISELLDSFDDADPIWNELFKRVNFGGVIYTGDELTVKQKIVRRKLTSEFTSGVSRDV